ncbi:MAG: hypothetical protein ABSC50_07325 [Candidatus Bathyarchaeia archaeon]
MARRQITLRPFALTTFVFGLLVWLYTITIQLTHPQWLTEPFSHLQFPPFHWRLDDVGIIAFAVSAFGFFVWQLEKND